jgi:hypothetical protein
VKLHKADRTITEREVALFENDLGTRLPPEYRSFLLEHNGGEVVRNDRNVVNVPGFHGPVTIQCFYELRAVSKGCRLEWFHTTNQELAFVPRDVLAIASTIGGDNVCIGLSQSIYGVVYLVDHDDYSYTSAQGVTTITDSVRLPDGVYTVARSFNAFLAQMEGAGPGLELRMRG